MPEWAKLAGGVPWHEPQKAWLVPVHEGVRTCAVPSCESLPPPPWQ